MVPTPEDERRSAGQNQRMSRTPREIADHLAAVREQTQTVLWDLAGSMPAVTDDPFTDVSNVVRVQGEHLTAVTEVLLAVMTDLEALARAL
ncbi:MAG: hypothetical protein QOE97_1262 [Pseudonocardiales bacterium]|jgi:hypothetical protein|nr:hypothetical protein [Pseudonocardiales bacterium]